MNARRLVTLLLGAFVAVALIFVARNAGERGAPPAPPGAVAARASTTTDPAAVQPAAATDAPAGPAAAPVSAGQPENVEDTPAPSPSPLRTGPAAAAAPARAAHRVVAMYFHGDVRCATCRKVEAFAREAVEEGFPSETASGAVEFRAVNVERAENAHFIQDFQLTNKSVVVVDETDGRVERWVKLDDVWSLVGDHDACIRYVRDAVRAYVED